MKVISIYTYSIDTYQNQCGSVTSDFFFPAKKKKRRKKWELSGLYTIANLHYWQKTKQNLGRMVCVICISDSKFYSQRLTKDPARVSSTSFASHGVLLKWRRRFFQSKTMMMTSHEHWPGSTRTRGSCSTGDEAGGHCRGRTDRRDCVSSRVSRAAGWRLRQNHSSLEIGYQRPKELQNVWKATEARCSVDEMAKVVKFQTQ